MFEVLHLIEYGVQLIRIMNSRYCNYNVMRLCIVHCKYYGFIYRSINWWYNADFLGEKPSRLRPKPRFQFSTNFTEDRGFGTITALVSYDVVFNVWISTIGLSTEYRRLMVVLCRRRFLLSVAELRRIKAWLVCLHIHEAYVSSSLTRSLA